MENIFTNFLLDSGLYASIFIEEENISDFIELVKGNVKISTYCKECEQERVFTMKPIKYYHMTGQEGNEKITCESLGDRMSSMQDVMSIAKIENKNTDAWELIKSNFADITRLMNFEFICSMDEKHHLDFTVLVNDNSFMKIGQFPSIADITFPGLDDYKHVISKQDRSELGTAIGLFANGVGAGSYVYLRRILERLVYQAKENAGDKVDNDSFENAKVADRIKMLEGYLPDILIQNTTIYGILSKGIHELSEEDCLNYFPVVKECIFQILGMWENMRKKQADEDALNKALNVIIGKIK
ncbi:hypothetical protein [Catenibacterium sp.]|uniref:hypothetical protein n=1 Tax=Catenibacterium sp. TaxID=2049022 RepID=UPI002E767685|nr:hypothetical protein [Catenibacterium sp.]MEE0491492.1 hypothetical protein [Catenibacterium sp.]